MERTLSKEQKARLRRNGLCYVCEGPMSECGGIKTCKGGAGGPRRAIGQAIRKLNPNNPDAQLTMMLAMLDEQPEPEDTTSLEDTLDEATIATMDFLAAQGHDADARQLEAEIQHMATEPAM